MSDAGTEFLLQIVIRLVEVILDTMSKPSSVWVEERQHTLIQTGRDLIGICQKLFVKISWKFI